MGCREGYPPLRLMNETRDGVTQEGPFVRKLISSGGGRSVKLWKDFLTTTEVRVPELSAGAFMIMVENGKLLYKQFTFGYMHCHGNSFL